MALTGLPWLLALAAVAGLACIGAVAFVLLRLPAPSAAEFATAAAPVRSAASLSASTVLGELQRGQTVAGSWITASDGQTKWLKTKWAGTDGYVWSRDLSDRARPPLVAAPSGGQTVQVASPVRAEADDVAPVVDTVFVGQSVQAAGTTADGWTEISLSGGDVGYVKAAVFQPPAPPPPPPELATSADQGAVPDAATSAADAAVSAQIAAQAAAQAAQQAANNASLANAGAATRYACAPAFDLSSNPLPDASPMAISVDESRSCINDRALYVRIPNGGLKKIMLSDRDHRASLLVFSPNRQVFERVDYMLAPDVYAQLRRNNPGLLHANCPAAGDAQGAAIAQMSLARATPNVNLTTLPGTTWRRTAWRCAVAP